MVGIACFGAHTVHGWAVQGCYLSHVCCRSKFVTVDATVKRMDPEATNATILLVNAEPNPSVVQKFLENRASQ